MPDEETIALLEASREADDTPPMPFPLDALNKAQQEAVAEVFGTFQQDASVAGMVSLSGLAGAIGSSLLVQGASRHVTPANILAVIAAPRSYGKSTSRQVMEPLFEKNSEMVSEWKKVIRPQALADIRIAGVKLKAAEKEVRGGEDPREEIALLVREIEQAERTAKAARMVVLSGNFTLPTLSEIMSANNGQVMSFDPEAGDLLRILLGKYNDDKADCGLILSGYTGEPYGEGRIGRGSVLIERPLLTACWLCQPHILKELLSNQEALDRGLGARLLYTSIGDAPPPFNDGRMRGVDSSRMEPWFDVLRAALVRREVAPYVVKATRQAAAAFLAYDNEVIGQRRGIHKDIQGELGRCAENAIRLSLGQAAADAYQAGDEVPEELALNHAERGIALARYSCDQYVRLLSIGRSERSMGRLEKLTGILRRFDGRRSVRDLKNSNGFEEAELHSLVSEFSHVIRLDDGYGEGKAGRPSATINLVTRL
jgi:hypothetical protein